MKIGGRQDYHGIPILGLRKFLRAMSNSSNWSVVSLSQDLGVSTPVARALVGQLATDGYISAVSPRNTEWENTEKGNGLGCASAAALLTRRTAEIQLQEFLRRVQQVNSSAAPFALWIDRVLLLGSMLGTKERVSDVDLSIKLINKPAYDVLSRDRISIALTDGRRFGSILEQVIWPRQEILLYLRNRRRSLSFIEWNEE